MCMYVIHLYNYYYIIIIHNFGSTIQFLIENGSSLMSIIAIVSLPYTGCSTETKWPIVWFHAVNCIARNIGGYFILEIIMIIFK